MRISDWSSDVCSSDLIWQWDDHEVVNNWSPGKQLDERYQTKDIHSLVGRARQAWLEYAPMRLQKADAGARIYRKLAYGPMLDEIGRASWRERVCRYV